MVRVLRYAPPNLVTILAVFMGLMSLVLAHEQRFVAAAWMIVWATLLDRVDGAVARVLRATSDFGVQMDSLADLVNFGVAPAFLIYSALSSVEGLGYGSGGGRTLLLLACGLWVAANTLRLARFNVLQEEPQPGQIRVFFGLPTTYAAGLVAIWFLFVVKYMGGVGGLATVHEFRGARLLGELSLPAHSLRAFPPALILLAFLMISNVPNPKLQWPRRRMLGGLVVVGLVLGAGLGLLRVYPEIMAPLPTVWGVVFVGWGLLSPRARDLSPPRTFPADDGRDEPDDEDELVERDALG